MESKTHKNKPGCPGCAVAEVAERTNPNQKQFWCRIHGQQNT